MFPYLKSQRVNLELLQEAASNELMEKLESIEGSKVLVLDTGMIGPMCLVTRTRQFAERGIRLFSLKSDMRFPKDMQNIIYIVRPQVPLMDHLVTHVKSNSVQGRQFHIFFVPRRSCLCIKQLENREVIGAFGRLEELTWNFLPLDSDVVSMEMPHAYRDVTVDGDTTSLYQAALGLVQLQRLFGRIPKIYGKGVQAQLVWDHAKQLAIDEKTLYNGDKGAIDQLILLDRNIDLLSPLATQLTYEGLIDEFYGIQQNQLTLPAEHFAQYPGGNSADSSFTVDDTERLTVESSKKTILLHSGVPLYAELRDKNFNEVRLLMGRKVKEIQELINVNQEEDWVRKTKLVVDRLPDVLEQKKTISEHTNIAHLIVNKIDMDAFNDDLGAEQQFMVCADIDKHSSYIEDQIARRADLRNVLRLICLQCAAASGFKERVLNYYKRELAQVYGLEVLLTMSNLEKAGLLRLQTESRAYTVLRKTLHLTVDDNLEVDPKDISYVHSFYAPLTARLVEHSLKPLGWQTLKSQINNLPGPTFEDFQVQLIGIGGRHAVGATSNDASLLDARRVVLVFFIGGCTFAEIAALRFLAAQEDNNVQFVIATTNIINKNTFLDSLMAS